MRGSPHFIPTILNYPKGPHMRENERMDNPKSEMPVYCPQQQQLLKTVQEHLIRIARLRCAATDALANKNVNLLRQLDRRVERAWDENKRGVVALCQHREEHGC